MSFYGNPSGGGNWPYTVYLIERDSPAQFWVQGRLDSAAGEWTSDAEKALKFSSAAEAQATADKMMEAGHGTVRVCDHIFNCGVAPEVQAPVPADHPVMVTWNAYKASPDYANTKKWATDAEHTDGSLWAAFCAGFAACEELPRHEPGYTDTAFVRAR